MGNGAAARRRDAAVVGRAAAARRTNGAASAVADPGVSGVVPRRDRADDRTREPRRPPRSNHAVECARDEAAARRRRARRAAPTRIGNRRRLGSLRDVWRASVVHGSAWRSRRERPHRARRARSRRACGVALSSRRHRHADDARARAEHDLRCARQRGCRHVHARCGDESHLLLARGRRGARGCATPERSSRSATRSRMVSRRRPIRIASGRPCSRPSSRQTVARRAGRS